MTLTDALISALDALRLHKLRSALTMLGIIIGVAAVIAMVAVGGGAREQVVAQIRSLGANLLVVSPGNVTQSGVRLGAGQASTLTDEDAAAVMKEIASVQVTAPFIRGGNVQIVAGGTNWATTVYGIDLGWFEAREWEVEHGRVFEPEEISRGAQVALIGQTVARTLYRRHRSGRPGAARAQRAGARDRRDGEEGPVHLGHRPGRRDVRPAGGRAPGARPQPGQCALGRLALRQGARRREPGGDPRPT